MLKAGAGFARYRIDGRLGDGGMATVYRAFEADLDRHVALKVLPSEFGQDKTFSARFDREAKMVAKLEHPNIIPIFAYGIEKGTPWMAMRLVGGGNLETLAGGRPLAPRRALSIVEEVAEALDYAHVKGVIHRDVKPANILLDESGRVYLVDFGIARMKEGAQRLTQAGLVAGTPSYMAPEQAAGGELDARVDIYSLGVVAYEMLTGTTPFRGDEPMEVLMKHISDPVPVPVPGSIPAGMVEPLMRCLAKRPEDRWPTARAFATALQEGLDASGEDASDDFAPTMAMDRPDFSATQPVERTYEPTVLSPRPTVAMGKAVSAAHPDADARPYEPTVFSARPSQKAPSSNGGAERRPYEPTVLSPRAKSPAPGAAPSDKAGKAVERANLSLAAIAMVGLGLLMMLGGLGYWWWSGRAADSAGGLQAPHELAQAGATDLPVPPGPEPGADAQAAPEPVAETPAEPTPPEPAPPEGAAEEPAPGSAKAATPANPPATRVQPRAASSPSAAPVPPPVKEAKPAISRAPRDASDDDEPAGKQAGPSDEPSAGEAVPESARTWTTAREVDRTAPLRLDRSVDLGVRVSGVPVDRVFITARDARAGIKKLFRKSADKRRFTAEFLLNCPRDGSQPKLNFEVELLREQGGVLERLSEKKSCEGHVKVSGDIALANLEDARKIRVRVRPAG